VERASTVHRILGLAAASERSARSVLRSGRAVAAVAVAPASLAWRSPLAAPLHRRTEEVGRSLEQDGHELVEHLRRLAHEAASPFVTRLAAWLAEEQLMELAVVELIARGTAARVAEQIVRAAVDGEVLNGRLADEVTERLLASDEMQRVLEHVLGSPELRAALSSQSVGLASDVAEGMRARTAKADAVAERLARKLSFRREQ
jgi:hypothetical protein